MASQTIPSGFLKLSPELRNEVYSYVFGRNEIQVTAARHIDVEPFAIRLRPAGSTAEKWQRPHHFLPLAQTCKEIRGKTYSFVFAHNEFNGRHLKRFHKFLVSLEPQQRNAIEIIRLTLSEASRIRVGCHRPHPESKLRLPSPSLHGLRLVVIEKWTDSDSQDNLLWQIGSRKPVESVKGFIQNALGGRKVYPVRFEIVEKKFSDGV